MSKRIIVATSIALLVQATALAEPYFDFGQIPGVPSEPNVEVNLNANLLAFVAEATKDSDVEIAAALSGIEGIRVRVYKEIEDAAAVAGFVDETSKALERAAWQRMIYVRDEREVRIYVKMRDREMTGMTVMVVGEGQAVFINVAGSIDPAQLGRVARAMGAGDVLGGFGAAHRSDAANRDRGSQPQADSRGNDDGR